MFWLFLGGRTVIAEPIKVEITPAPIAVMPGQTIKLGASLFNLPSNARLSWSIDAFGVGEAEKGRLSRDFQPTYTAPQIAPKKPIFIQILAFIDGVPVAGAKSKIIFVASDGGEKKGKLNNESGSARQGEPVQGDKPGLKGGSRGQAISGQKGEPKKTGQLEAKTRLMQKGEQGQKGASGKRGKAKGSNVSVKNSARQGEPVQGDKPGLKGGSRGQAISGQKGEPKKTGQLEAKTRLMQKGEQGQKGASGKRGKAKGSNVPVKKNDLGQKDEPSHIGKSGGIGQGESKGQSGKDVINWTAPPPPAPVNPGKVIWNSDPGRNRSSSCVMPSCGQSGPSAPPEPPPLLAPEQWN